MKRAFEDSVALLLGSGLGLAAMYLLDPQNGAGRRRQLKRRASEQYRKLPGLHGLSRRMRESVGQSLPDSSRWHGRPRQWTHDQSGAQRHQAAWGMGGAIGLIALGAGMAYLFDPQHGRARRAYVRDQLFSFANDASQLVRRSVRHLSNRIYGIVAEGWGWFSHEQVGDEQLAERVRSAIGRAGASSSQIRVSASHGHVTLRGALPRDQIRAVADTAYGVRGVQSLDCQITPAEPGDVVGRSQTTTSGSIGQGPGALPPT